MGYKGKGRQSGGFMRKCERAAHQHELRQQIHQSSTSNRRRPSATTNNSVVKTTRPNHDATQQRPRLVPRLGQLRGILRERQYQETYERMQRRRRDGFLPQQDRPVRHSPGSTNSAHQAATTTAAHPAGWILNYPNSNNNNSPHDEPGNEESEKNDGEQTRTIGSVHTLQSLSLDVFARYIPEYLVAMGRDDLHGTLSLLPSESLAELSILLSSRDGGGVNDDLAIVLGKHPHVEGLSFRAAVKKTGDVDDEDEVGQQNTAKSTTTLTDQAILELIPRLPRQEVEAVLDDWENEEDDDDLAIGIQGIDVMQVEGCSLRLRRLELLDCQHLSARVVLQLLERCCSITHLSLAGSFLRKPTQGSQILDELPRLLPALQVLDVTRCSWATPAVLTSFVEHYHELRQGSKVLPLVAYCQGHLRNYRLHHGGIHNRSSFRGEKDAADEDW